MKKFLLIVLGAILSVPFFYNHSFGFDAVKKLKSMKVCRKCNLVGVDLTGASLKKADPINSNLSGANLQGASFEKTNISKANLVGANIKKNEMKGAILCHTKTPWGDDNSGCK